MRDHPKPDETDSTSESHTPPTPGEIPTAREELPVVSVPNDQDMMAQEMADLFEEDQVTHQHGSSEPEGD